MVTREVSSDNWKYSDGWTSNDIPFTDITAATVDPYGQLLLIGSADGRFNFICVGTGLLLPYHSRCMRYGFGNHDKSRIQAISCALFPYNISRDRYRLLCALGTSSGLFQVFMASVKRDPPSSDDESTPRSLFRLVNLWVVSVRFDHAIDQEYFGIGDRGGTLCVCTQDMLAVSGGGNGRCVLVVLYSTTYPFQDWDEDTIEGLGAPVTAVTAEQNIIAVGLANGNVRIYSCIAYRPHVLRASIDHVSNVPITALAWGVCKELETLHHMILAVGDVAGSVRTYRVREDGQSALNEEIEGPGDPILSLHIRDHWMVAGTSTSVVRLWRLSDSAECLNLRTVDFRGRVNRKDTTIKRLMNVALFFDDLLRPVERFVPRCCGFHADRDQSGGEDDDDKNDHDEGSEQEIQESDSESHESPLRARLQFVEPQSEPEPRDDQILLLVSQCLTTDSEADRRGPNIAHPLRYRMLRAL